MCLFFHILLPLPPGKRRPRNLHETPFCNPKKNVILLKEHSEAKQIENQKSQNDPIPALSRINDGLVLN